VDLEQQLPASKSIHRRYADLTVVAFAFEHIDTTW